MESRGISATMAMSLTLCVLGCLLMLTMTVSEVEGRPSIDGWTAYHQRFGISDPQRRANLICHSSSEVRELCQRCAKLTKSKLAYPMCCEGRDNARNWCQELLMIG